MRGVCLDFQDTVQYQDNLDPEWHGFRSGPTGLHGMDSIRHVNVLYASGSSLIHPNTNYKIYHGRAVEVMNEITTFLWYIQGGKECYWKLGVVILMPVVKWNF